MELNLNYAPPIPWQMQSMEVKFSEPNPALYDQRQPKHIGQEPGSIIVVTIVVILSIAKIFSVLLFPVIILVLMGEYDNVT